MKKFSTMSGLSINEPPINEVVGKDIDIKDRMMELIDNSLRIIAYGSARKSILMETRIVGKEMLVESLLNLLKDEGIKEQLKSLESLKENVSDWRSIDEQIDLITENNIYKILVDNDSEVRSICLLLEDNGDEELDLKLDLNIDNIRNDFDVLDNKILVVSKMIESENYSFNDKLELLRNKLIYANQKNSE